LLQKLPIYLREQVLAKTHGEVFKKIKFFRDKSREFNSAVVHGLKPMNLGESELIYQHGDVCNEIYFIHTGKVKLFVDLHDFITDPE